MGIPPANVVGLKHCTQCGLCCASGCHVVPTDVPKLAKALGLSRKEMMAQLDFFPVARQWAVKTRVKNGACIYLDEGNKCTVQDAKPRGGKDYECWTPSTFAPEVSRKYLWQKGQIR